MSFSAIAQEIDPYDYSLVIGQITGLQGDVSLTDKVGNKVKLNNNELVSTDNIRQFTLTYNDNAFTLIDGRKDIEDKLTLVTGPRGKMKLVLNDYENNESYFALGEDTEVIINISGGIQFAPDQDGEGYDRDTLKWRNIAPYMHVKVIKGSMRVFFRPNGRFHMGSPSTENAEIRINESDIQDYIDYEVQVLTGEAAQQEEVAIDGDIQAMTQSFLMFYNVDSIEELSPDIREQLLSQIELFKESMKSLNEQFSNMPAMANNTHNTATVLKVYNGEAWLEETVVKSGEMSRIKGEIGSASKPEKF